MNRPETYAVRLLCACRLADRLHLAHTVIEVCAHDAVDLIRAGRACLVDDADMGPLLDRTKANGRPWVTPHTR